MRRNEGKLQTHFHSADLGCDVKSIDTTSKQRLPYTIADRNRNDFKSQSASEITSEFVENRVEISGPEKPWQPETWQDSTLFCGPGNRAIFSTFWDDFLTKLRRKPGEKRKNPLEKITNKYPMETAPWNCRFLSLVVVERVLKIATEIAVIWNRCDFRSLASWIWNR